MLQVASEYFKEKPVTGLNYLQEKGLLPVPHEPKRIALFLRNTRFLSKSAIGEYLGKPSSGDVLKEYVKTFPMEGNVRLIDAVRAFFESFRQALVRLLTYFSDPSENRKLSKDT